VTKQELTKFKKTNREPLKKLADELDNFLAEKKAPLSTRAIVRAWINGLYDKDYGVD
jgi:hypothetical protein